MTRFCPYCGVAVPSNCLTCPKCYKDIPRVEDPSGEGYADGTISREQTETPKKESRTEKSRTLSTLLAIIPAFFGILGLAQIYRNHRDGLGYYFLLAGLLFFVPSFFLIFNVWGLGAFIGVFRIVTYVILTLLYLLTALGALLDAAFGSVFKVIKF